MITPDKFIEYTVNSTTNRLYDSRVFKHHEHELQEYIDVNYPGKTIKEVAYILYYNIDETPKCKYCGNPLKFHDFIHGYREYCSKSCAALDKNVVQACNDVVITKDLVISTFVNAETGNIIKQRCIDTYLKKHGWYNSLLNYYNDSESCFETIYRIINDINIRPVCKTCGKPLTFNYGFHTYCSQQCANKDPEVLQKNANNVSKALTNAYKQNGDTIKQKRSETLNERYGINGSSPFCSSDVRDKAKAKIKDTYGVDNVFQLKQYHQTREQSQNRSILLQKENGYDIEYILDNGQYFIKVKNGCNIHGDIIVPLSVFNNRTRLSRRAYTTLCLQCNPLKSNESSIETIIKNILDELHINYIQHDRTLIKPYELDFYLPDYKVAIECNGIYWHQGEQNAKRILQKYELCKNAGIRLLYFWENDIIYKNGIIKSYLTSLFHKNERIYARKCIVKEIDSKTSKDFIDNNHLQGNINASIRLGLFYNDELVEVMTFGKLRNCLGSKSEDDTYELYRLCSKIGYTIVGGASKLLNYFINKYEPNEIITYCSNDISDGNVYEKIGFSYVKDCGQGFCYINGKTGERKNRYSLRKNVIDDKSGRTADEINLSNYWFKCYDTGNKKYHLLFN